MYVVSKVRLFALSEQGLCWIRCVHDCLFGSLAYTASWSTMLRQVNSSLKKDPSPSYNLPQNTLLFGKGLKDFLA